MMQLNIERAVLEKLLHNAAAVSRLIGHLDDSVGGAAVGPIADRVDEVVHTLSELLGAPELVDASVPDACFVFPEGFDEASTAGAPLSSQLTVAGRRPSALQPELLRQSSGHGEPAVRVSPHTTVIALVVLAVVAVAVSGCAP
jgi:hypothetical protein